jgi:hypothetical protein
MKAYLNVIKVIEDELSANPFVNTVEFGDIFDMDLSKQTLFPLAHYIVGTITYENSILVVPVSLMVCAIPNTDEDFKYTLAETMPPIVKLLEILDRGDLRHDRYHLRGTPTLQPFKHRAENDLAGWECSFNVEVPNDMGNESEQ